MITTWDEGQQTPPPDDRPYFGKQAFDTKAGSDDYDPKVSDSENELCLIKFSKEGSERAQQVTTASNIKKPIAEYTPSA